MDWTIGVLEFDCRRVLGIFLFTTAFRNRDSSVGIALGYGLDDRGCRVRFPA
jgi:hypothetical protein